MLSFSSVRTTTTGCQLTGPDAAVSTSHRNSTKNPATSLKAVRRCALTSLTGSERPAVVTFLFCGLALPALGAWSMSGMSIRVSCSLLQLLLLFLPLFSLLPFSYWH